ncbi:Fructosamine deglycase frlB [Mycobacteroides abscessus subsp. abscessus]|nr:Fructosamine deglycase frlB [Mycobacteroides abscessus subsp. abscessus]
MAAAEFCRERGATTLALVAEADTPLTKIVDYCITTGSEKHSFDTFFMLLYMVSFRFMHVERFAEKITKELTVIDTKDFKMDGISDEFRKHFAVNINWAVLSRISVYLERERNHPLELRRYYRKMEY